MPMRRLATPEEIAEPVLRRLSDAASTMSGATIRCPGGLQERAAGSARSTAPHRKSMLAQYGVPARP
jgi:NAD(P)-dependent dehydrogenase (short-subunit alcohol dehydrogenase family)